MDNYTMLTAKVDALKAELPGITFGYIGNVGVDRSGPFDDRSWYVFLPHPGRIGTYADRVFVGHKTLESVRDWSAIEFEVRRAMKAVR